MRIYSVRFVHLDKSVGSDFTVLHVEASDMAAAAVRAARAVLAGGADDAKEYRISVTERT